MTDSELIAILTRKLPEELTLEESETLLRRLSASPELRRKLLEEIPLEAYVAEAIGRSRQQVAAAPSAAAKSKLPTPATMALSALVALPLVALAAVVAVGLWPPGGADQLATNAAKGRVAKPAVAGQAKNAESARPQSRDKGDKSTKTSAKAAAVSQTPPAGRTNRPAAPPPPPPWQAAMDQQGEPPPYTDVAFASFE